MKLIITDKIGNEESGGRGLSGNVKRDGRNLNANAGKRKRTAERKLE